MSQSDSTLIKGKYVKANGLNIYYEEYGAGEPVLLLHGDSGIGSMWEKMIPSFSQHFKVFVPDRRGHGRTDNPAGEMTIAMRADDMVAFCQEMAIHDPLICGYSGGGDDTLNIGIRYPQLAKGLIIGAATYSNSESHYQTLRELGVERPGEVDFTKFLQVSPDWAASLQEWHSSVYGPDYWKKLLINLSTVWLTPLNYTQEDLKKITTPTLLLVGDRDGFVPVEQAVEMYRLIPRAELAVIPQSDHMFLFEKPDLLTNPCLDFFLRHRSGKA